MAAPSSSGSPGVKIGPDQVWFLSRTVVIYALHEMPDWEVRGFARNPIYFQGNKYYLIDIGPGKPPHAVRYELVPWPDDFHDESKISFTYDEASVTERDVGHKMDRHEELVHNLLLPFFPLLGFCWSGFKERVLSRYGFAAVTITGASLLLLFGLFLLESVFVFYFHSGFAEMLCGSRGILGLPVGWLDYFIFFTTPLDCAIRYSQILRHDDTPDGYLEWLFKWTRRKSD